ncbi:MAG TPA: hypothetical protein VF872_09300 [Gaiellaceae bacterium]
MLGLESPGVIGTEFTGDDANPSGIAAMLELEGGLMRALPTGSTTLVGTSPSTDGST